MGQLLHASLVSQAVNSRRLGLEVPRSQGYPGNTELLKSYRDCALTIQTSYPGRASAL